MGQLDKNPQTDGGRRDRPKKDKSGKNKGK